MIWNVKDFENLIEVCYGGNQLEKIQRHLPSVSWKLMLAQYHAEESKRLYRSYLSEESVEGTIEELIQVVGQVLKSASGSEEADKFKEARVLSEAHLIAYAQSLHSIADILAHVIYLALDLDNNLTKPIAPEKLSLYRVYECMYKEEVALDVVETVKELKQSSEFIYLQAYVNTTKHYTLLDVNHPISLQPDSQRYGIQILPFEYKGCSFPAKWADDFVFQDFAVIREKIICIGNELNQFLENLAEA